MIAHDLVVRGARVMDEHGRFPQVADVRVTGGVVAEVGPRLAVLKGERVVDATGKWLMPGIIDCHAHLACFEDDPLGYLEMSTTRWAMEMTANATRLLDMGITSIRDPGGADAGIRDGLAAGLAAGPTVQVAISFLSQTGGHGDGFLRGVGAEISNGFLSHEYPGRPPHIADGPEGVTRAIREILRAGADWIKICTTGGLLSPGLDHPDVAEFTRDELRAIAEESRRSHTPMMAHAYGGEGLTNAVEIGVRSIEHGARMTEKQAGLMAERDCYLVPTLGIMHDLVALEKGGDVNDASAARIRDIEGVIGQAVRIAREAGVKIAMGSDLIQQRGNLRELSFMGKAGMSSEEVLLAATAGGADLCGIGGRYGRIAPGFIFDAIALDADPSDLSVFERPEPVSGVIKAGRIHRWDDLHQERHAALV